MCIVRCGQQGNFKDPPPENKVLGFTLASSRSAPSGGPRAPGIRDTTGGLRPLHGVMRLSPPAAVRRPPSRTRSAGSQPPPAPPAPRHPRPRPASRPRAAPAPRGPSLRRDGSTGAGCRGSERSGAVRPRTARGRASERRVQRAALAAREPGRAPPWEAAFLPARRPQRDGDAALRSRAGAREGPGAAAGGPPPRALAALEPRLALLLGARRLPGGLGWGPGLLRPPASSLPGGELHLVLYLESTGEGADSAEDEG